MAVRVRPAVAPVPVYKPGKPPAAVAGDLVAYKLSSNENPYPPLPGVLEATAQSSGADEPLPGHGQRRPDGGPERPGWAWRRTGWPSAPDRWPCSTTCCRRAARPATRWSTPGAASRRTRSRWPSPGATAVPVPLGPGAVHDLGAMHAAITALTRVVLLCTPNNPTGPALRHADVVAFLDAVPEDVLVVVDEAYVEFVTDPDRVRGLDLVAERGNVVVLRTFSKAYGLAGFRVGYGVAAPEIAAAVRAVALPFGVSVPAQAAVVASLEAEPALLERVDAPGAGPGGAGERAAGSRLRRAGGPGQLRLAARRDRERTATRRRSERRPSPSGPTRRATTRTASGSPSVSRRPTPGFWRSRRRWRTARKPDDQRACRRRPLASSTWRRPRPDRPTAAPSAAGPPAAGWVAAESARPGAAWWRPGRRSWPR